MTSPTAGSRPGTTPAFITWQLLADRSTAAFSVRDKLVTTVRGTIPVTGGEVVTDPGGTVVRARLELAASGVDTGNAHRDRDVQKPPFLDSANHPTIVVEAGPTVRTQAGWTVHAQLSARGYTCPLELDVTPTSLDDERVRVHVTARFDRKGLRMPVPTVIVGRYLDLDVDAIWQITDRSFGLETDDHGV